MCNKNSSIDWYDTTRLIHRVDVEYTISKHGCRYRSKRRIKKAKKKLEFYLTAWSINDGYKFN